MSLPTTYEEAQALYENANGIGVSYHRYRNGAESFIYRQRDHDNTMVMVSLFFDDAQQPAFAYIDPVAQRAERYTTLTLARPGIPSQDLHFVDGQWRPITDFTAYTKHHLGKSMEPSR